MAVTEGKIQVQTARNRIYHVDPKVGFFNLTMATSAEDDYDKLTPEQREIRDKADRAREAEEQASM